VGSGFNFFTDAYNVSPPQTGQYVDVDVSGYIPAGSTGAVLEIRNTGGSDYECRLRKNGSTEDFVQTIGAGRQHSGFIGVDENRVFEAYTGSTSVEVYLTGYSDTAVTFFTDYINKTPGTTGSWVDVDVSENVPAGATGVIVVLASHGEAAANGGVRNNGSTDTFSLSYVRATLENVIFQLCGVDGNRVLEARIDNSAIRVKLYGYTTSPVTFKVNANDVSLTATSAWTDIDVTSMTADDADGAIIDIKNTAWTNHNANLRKDGSGDNRVTNVYVENFGAQGHCKSRGIGLAAGQVLEGWIANTAIDFYLIGYCRPGVTLKEVTDSLSLSDAVLRNKTFVVIDSVTLSDLFPLRDKTFEVVDSVTISEEVFKSRLLEVFDSVGLADSVLKDVSLLLVSDSLGLLDLVLADKILQVLESIGLAETVTQWVVGAGPKTKIYLIIGDLAIRLTGEG